MSEGCHRIEWEEERGLEISDDDEEEEENGKAASDVYKRILQVTDRSRNEKVPWLFLFYKGKFRHSRKHRCQLISNRWKPIGIPERPTVLSTTRTSGDYYGFCGDDCKTPTAIANDRVDIWSEVSHSFRLWKKGSKCTCDSVI